VTAPEPFDDAPTRSSLRPASLRLQAFANVAGNLSLYAVIFLLTPLAIRKLGSEGWGIWQIVNAATAYAMQLNLGLGTAIHQQVAYNVARRDYAQLSRAFTGGRLYLTGAGVILLGLLFAFGRPLAASLVEPRHVELTWTALVLTIGLTALTLPLRLFPSALTGLQRGDLWGLVQGICSVLLLLGVWLGFQGGMGLAGFALLMTLGPLMVALPCWLLTRRLLPRAALAWTLPSRAHLREMIGYGFSTLVFVFGTVVLYQTMKFVAAWRCGGAEAAGYMGLAVSIVNTLGTVITPLVGTLHARFGQLHGEGRVDEARTLFERGFSVTVLLVVPATAFLVADAREIFDAWLGGAVAPALVTQLGRTTQPMLLGQGVYLAALPCYYALLGAGQHRAFGIAMLGAAFANAGLGFLATSFVPRIELLGAVFGLVVGVLSLGVIFPLALRRLRVPLGRLIRALLVPVVASMPGLLAVALNPPRGHAILDLATDAALFALLTAPGLEWARRRILAAPNRRAGTALG
jgi:O-antigen/teichoic acid export membrane protein